MSGILFAAGIFLWAGQASALSLTLTDCDAQGCEGSTLFLETIQSPDPNFTWRVTLTINTDGYTGDLAGTDGIVQVGFKSVLDWTSVTVLSRPAGSDDFTSAVEASINSNGDYCAPVNGNTSKVCSSGFAAVDGELTWTFDILGGTLIEAPETWHIGAQYGDDFPVAADDRGHIISAIGVPIPEPTAALVFALGFGVVSGAVRRKA